MDTSCFYYITSDDFPHESILPTLNLYIVFVIYIFFVLYIFVVIALYVAVLCFSFFHVL